MLRSSFYSKDKAKILLLSGFLGAGKTTLLSHILTLEKDLSDTVVLVNEFGKLGIDSIVLRKLGKEIVELSSGCICCTLKTGLVRKLREIWNQFTPKRIVIEATGVAQPGPLRSVVADASLSSKMEVHKIVTVLDAKFWGIRQMLGTLFMNQLKEADLILLNKIDLVEREKIPELLSDIERTIPYCVVLPVEHCKIDLQTLWKRKMRGLSGSDFGTPGEFEPTGELTQKGNEEFRSFSFMQNHTLDERRFRGFIQGLPSEVLRVKGVVKFRDRCVFLSYVGGTSNWEPWDRYEATRLVFVGYGVMRSEVFAKLRDCIIRE